MAKFRLSIGAILVAIVAHADITVSDVKVFSGHPWKEVVIRYTITGTDDMVDFIRVTAEDKSANKSYVWDVHNSALWTEGRHKLRWNAVAEGAKFASKKVVFSVAVVSYGGVRLWEDGPIWAECNVGAMKPEEAGYYFSWGDTVGYKRNAANDGWASVETGRSFSFKSCPTNGKSNSALMEKGYIDSSGNLTASYDAATTHMNTPWRMPKESEFEALIKNCDTEWITHNGVCGYLVKGRGAYSLKSIFLPAAGYGLGSDINGYGVSGGYWSSKPVMMLSNYEHASYLSFDSDALNAHAYFNWRYCGRSVRPIRVQTE